MNFSKTAEIAADILKNINLDIEVVANGSQPFLRIAESQQLLSICNYLHSSPQYFFDFLNCITAVDNGEAAGTIDIIYHLSSIPFEHSVILKLQIDRDLESNGQVDSLSGIWKTADWHEREIFDFFGVKFNNHPDLRRILLPADWVGHPLRKDYQEQETYHGIKVKY
jgi:NADH-quinone oxidoreductase subunit C